MPMWPFIHTASPISMLEKSVLTSLQTVIMESAPMSGTLFAL